MPVACTDVGVFISYGGVHQAYEVAVVSSRTARVIPSVPAAACDLGCRLPHRGCTTSAFMVIESGCGSVAAAGGPIRLWAAERGRSIALRS
jgi:hypothetical protein